VPPRDLVIGAYSGYDWSRVKFWANSLVRSGFDGYKVVVVYESDADTVQALVDLGFMIVAFRRDETGFHYLTDDDKPIHVGRFLHFWKTLTDIPAEHRPRYVIATDVRDVVFQLNPSTWLEHRFSSIGRQFIIAPTEPIQLQHEPWGIDNFSKCFGPIFYRYWKERSVYNVGTLAGTFDYMKDLCLSIYQTSFGRPIDVIDQTVFNFLLGLQPWKDHAEFLPMHEGWACQAGVTANPVMLPTFKPHLLEDEPTWDPPIVRTKSGEPFCLVHQYDRVPEWRSAIEHEYDDKLVT